MEFQSTQPSQAVTNLALLVTGKTYISIHTALAGCDITEDRKLITLAEFQSTQPSQAVTPTSGISVPYPGRFQSTQPSQAVTLSAFFTWMRLEFQSTQPSQAVTERKANPQKLTIISIHTALAGCDYNKQNNPDLINISIHTALAGCDEKVTDEAVKCLIFQSTQPSQAVTIVPRGCKPGPGYFNPHSPRRL